MRNRGCHTDYFLVETGTKQSGEEELQGHQRGQAPKWAAAAPAVGRAVLEECGMTAVHSTILEWHMVDAAGGCTEHLMVVVSK